MGRSFGIVSLIFGIISIPIAGILAPMFEALDGLFGMPQVANLIIILGWVFITVAIIFGIIGLAVDKPIGLATAGLVLGIISLIVRFIFGYLFTMIMGLAP